MDHRRQYLQQLDQLDKTINAWYEKLRPVTAIQLRYQAAPGKWSILHVLAHLVKTEEVVLQYCRKKVQAADLRRVSPMTSLRASLLPLLVGKRLYRYKAPRVVAPAPDLEYTGLEDLFTEWEKVRKDWKQFIEQLPEDKLDKEVYRQPNLGRLGWKGTFIFFENHMKRHWKQIEEIVVSSQ